MVLFPFLDPTHYFCEQELETSEVMKQLNHIEMVSSVNCICLL